MSAPAFILGAALLFWGWQTGFWVLGALLAVFLEGSRLTLRRWDFSREDFIRVSDLCTVLFVVSTAYSYLRLPATAAFMKVSEWLPVTLFTLIAAQAYSLRGEVAVAALALSWRARGVDGPRGTVDISYPYLILCVICASAANAKGFYLGMFALAGWALFQVKPRRTSVVLWGSLLAGSGALGYAGQIKLHALQTFLETKGAQLLYGTPEVRTDPYRARTAIGRIGALKQSGEIVLRVETDPPKARPPLLMEAAYDLYKDGQWYAKEAAFSVVAPSPEGAWSLSSGKAESRLRISGSFRGGEGVLVLPLGAAKVSGLYTGNLSRNRFGAVRVELAPEWAPYEAAYGKPAALGTPDAADLAVPPEEASAVARIARELSLTPATAPGKLEEFFNNSFTYSIYQGPVSQGKRPIEDFLTRSRAGHCELFATATVLLLRQAGVPARYATGYSPQEFSAWEKRWIVRQRHGHAWALAYVDGEWTEIDTTPASWDGVEAARAAWWESADDLFNWAKSDIFLWRWKKKEPISRRVLAWVLLPLFGAALWRFSPRARLSLERVTRPPIPSLPGVDSEWYAVERRLVEEGRGRRPEERAAKWLSRIGETPLVALLELHERYRFDPKGLGEAERRSLAEGAVAWSKSKDRQAGNSDGKTCTD